MKTFGFLVVLVAALACSTTNKRGSRDGAVPDDAQLDERAAGGGAGAAGHGQGGTAGGAAGHEAGGVSGTAGHADGGPDAAADAAIACSFGAVSSQATTSNLSLFGTPVYFNGGQPLPAGTYVVTYVDGCIQYGPGQGWTVDAYANGSDGWWLIGATTSDKILVLPGTVGYTVGQGAYAAFDDCVAASLLVSPVTFTFAGGVLGVWLQDNPYSDNMAGVDGRNPSWRLDSLGACPDGGLFSSDASARD